jgi:hypothetical protein
VQTTQASIVGKGAGIMSIVGHLLGALFKTFFKVIFSTILGAAVGGGATLLVAYQQTNQRASLWPPHGATEIAAIAIAVLSGYAIGLTVLTGAAVKGLLSAGGLAVKEATTTGNIIEDVVKVADRK